MHQSEKGKGWRSTPGQQAQQPQLSDGVDELSLARKKNAVVPGEGLDGHHALHAADHSDPVVDDARFSAGIVGLYTALLKEPIPEKMLRLIDAIANQEKSTEGQEIEPNDPKLKHDVKQERK
jgi:hypothetical protein